MNGDVGLNAKQKQKQNLRDLGSRNQGVSVGTKGAVGENEEPDVVGP